MKRNLWSIISAISLFIILIAFCYFYKPFCFNSLYVLISILIFGLAQILFKKKRAVAIIYAWIIVVVQIVFILFPGLYYSLFGGDKGAYSVLTGYETIKENTCVIVDRERTTFPHSLVGTSSGEKVQIPWADNMSCKPKHLSRFLQVGDSIAKRINSDTLFIFRKNEKYHFVLKKRIWK